MEWLKDKKNLPIVAALAVFVLLGAGGFIAFYLGAFSGSTAPAPPQVATRPGPPSGPVPGGYSPSGPGGYPGGPPLGSRPPSGLPAGRTVSGLVAVPKNPNLANPKIGPDPFGIPNSAQKLAKLRRDALPVKLPIRDVIGPLNLFRLRPPTPPAPPLPTNQVSSATGGIDPANNYRLSGIINGPDGINAIIETGGQSQSVKPGDNLPDGTNVRNIQATSATLKTTTGSVFTLTLSAGNPDTGGGNGFNNGFNGGNNGFNGQGFPPGGPQYPQPNGGQQGFNGQQNFNQ